MQTKISHKKILTQLVGIFVNALVINSKLSLFLYQGALVLIN